MFAGVRITFQERVSYLFLEHWIMVVSEMMGQFAEGSPVSVMARATMEYALPDEVIDQVFRDNATCQREEKLLFSTIVHVMTLVVCRTRKSVREAYLTAKDRVTASVQALYVKLQRTEPGLVRALVRTSAQRLEPVMRQLQAVSEPLFPGYRTKILDGAHLAATQRRIQETRTLIGVPLPAQALVVLQPDERLIVDMFPCEDAHAQERSLFDAVLNSVEAKDLLMADRNFCTTMFLFGLQRRKAAFIIRQHKSTLYGKGLLGERRCLGRVETGVVYEQEMEIHNPLTGEEMTVRRVTIELDKPTESGATEIHVLTNLPAKFEARRIARAYLQRWRIENAFQQVEQAYRGEINTLSYPKAALLGFAIALLMYNVQSVVKASIAAEHGAAGTYEKLSTYYLASEVSATHDGMMIAIPAAEWTLTFGTCNARDFARFLRRTATHVKPDRWHKQTRGPKKPLPKRTGRKTDHVSAKRILDQRKTTLARAV